MVPQNALFEQVNDVRVRGLFAGSAIELRGGSGDPGRGHAGARR